MPNSKSWAINGTFLLADVSLLYVCFRLGLLLRNSLADFVGRPYFGYSAVRWEVVAPLAHLGVLIGVLALLFERLYPGYGMTAVKELEKTSTSITLAFFVLAGASYLYRPLQDYPRPILLIAWGIAVIIVPLARFLLRNLLSQTSWYGLPVVIFGDGAWAQSVKRSLKHVRRLGWRPDRIIPIAEIDECAPTLAGYQLAVLATNGGQPVGNLARVLNRQFPRVVVVREKDNFGSLWVEPADINGQLGLIFQYHLLNPWAIWVKRVTDILGAGFLLIVLSPFFLLFSLMIALDSRGPIFYCQQRLGQGFRVFRIWKFRTMVVDAERKLQAYLEANPEARAEYDVYHKLRKDPRLTRAGKLLRKFSMDELPQLWNVLRGEMHLVGPRAYMPEELSALRTNAEIILRVPPGMTGWWQVTRGDGSTFEQRLQMEEYYISNWSLWMDFFIVLKTLWILTRGRGV